MFGFGSRQKKSSGSARNTNDDVLAQLGLSGAHFDVSADIDIPESDLEDPDLLRELSALAGPTAQAKKPTTMPKKPAAQKQVDLDAIAAMASHDHDVHVEVTDEDLMDPNLLGELHALSGGAVDENPFKNDEDGTGLLMNDVTEDAHFEVEHETANPFVSANDLSPEHEHLPEPHVEVPSLEPEQEREEDEYLPLEMKLKSTDKALVEKYLRIEKVKAATRNRAGDKAGAKDAFHAYKELEKHFQNLSLQSKPQPAQPKVATSSSLPADSSNDELVGQLQSRQQEYKKAALMYKKQNDLVKAKEMLMVSKKIDGLLEQASLGLPVSGIPPKPAIESALQESKLPPSHSVSAPAQQITASRKAPAQKRASLPPVPLEEEVDHLPISPTGAPDQVCRKLMKQLDKQIQLCTSIAAKYYQNGDKESALRFHKYKKNLAADLASLESHNTVPKFHYEDVTYTIERTFTELALNDMEVCVLRAVGLNSKEVPSSDIESYVNWEVGWPTEGPNASQGKGDTTVVKRSMDPIYNFTKVIKIERSKPFQRFLERKKAVFEVFHSRGFLRKPLSLGKGLLKLDALMNQSEVSELIELTDASNRRPTGAKLEVRMRLRQPLLKSDVITSTEKWLFIDDFKTATTSTSPSPVSALSPKSAQRDESNTIKSTSSLVPQPKPVATKTSPASSATGSQAAVKVSPSPSPAGSAADLSSKKQAANATATTPSPSSSTVQADGGLDDVIEKFESVDLIVSNNVLEAELDQVTRQIAQYQVKKAKVPEDLTDRKQQLEIKMQLLVLQVQMGKLTMDAYLAQVRQAITDTKSMAVQFKRGNKLDLAKRALARIKIMQDEVDEAAAQ